MPLSPREVSDIGKKGLEPTATIVAANTLYLQQPEMESSSPEDVVNFNKSTDHEILPARNT